MVAGMAVADDRPLDERERRLAKNEALFRAINEEIGEAAFRFGGDDEHVYEFLCECANIDCDLRLPLSLDDYERVRTNPVWFAVAPDHALPEIEDVVDRRGDYDVVEKRGEAARLVAGLDLRSS
jgi:hypothetical protein